MDKIHLYDKILSPLVTEKSTNLSEQNKITFKVPNKANKIKTMQVIGDVEGKDVVLVDDLIDTGGTISKASNLIMEKGAKSVRAIITHPILSGNAEENIDSSSLKELVVTDSVPLKFKNKKIKVLSIAGLFAKAIRKIHENESTSSLFINR